MRFDSLAKKQMDFKTFSLKTNSKCNFVKGIRAHYFMHAIPTNENSVERLMMEF